MDCVEAINSTTELFTFLKDLEHHNPEKFKKAGILRCGHCRATGLRNGNDTSTPCKNCHGIGYKGLKEFKEESICPSCNGSGFELRYENHVVDCTTCEGGGRINWVTAIRKGIDIQKIW